MSESRKRAPDDNVVFITSTKPLPGEVRLHADWGDKVLVRSLSSVRDDWTAVTEQVMSIIGDSARATTTSGFTLDELSFGLAFTAKGKLAFIAEAGAEASVTLTFKRHST